MADVANQVSKYQVFFYKILSCEEARFRIIRIPESQDHIPSSLKLIVNVCALDYARCRTR
jgi:hypothetical protein